MKYLIFILTILIYPCASLAREVVLEFDYYYNNIKIADTIDTINISRAEKSYQIKSESRAVGLAKVLYGDVTRESEGELDIENNFQMARYQENKAAQAPKRAQRWHEELHLNKGGERRTEIVEGLIFDHLTSLYQSYLKGYPLEGTITVTDGWRLKEYTYEAGAETKRQTPLGEINIVPVTRHSDRGKREIWLTPDIHYLPVYLYVDDKGHIFHSQIKRISLDGHQIFP